MIEEFLNFISENLLLLQFISLAVSAVLIGFTAFFIIKLNFVDSTIDHYIDVLSSKGIVHRRSIRIWKKIKKMLASGDEKKFKEAVLESDRILNDILKMAGYPGLNLDERLAPMNSAQLSNIEEIKQVHKLHNKIISEPSFQISLGEAQVAIAIYEKAFQELKLID